MSMFSVIPRRHFFLTKLVYFCTATSFACVALLSAAPAWAAPQCDQRESVLEVLESKYQEAPVALGVTHNGSLVEVLSTGNGTTWSIIVTTPQGMSCLVAAGEGWRAMEAVAADPEA